MNGILSEAKAVAEGREGLVEGSSFSVEPAAETDCPRNWFAVYTSSHHEKRVAWLFSERGIEFFLPCFQSLRRWKNRCQTTLALPLFPNYVFVRIDRRKRVGVLAVPGVLALVGSGKSPAPLPDSEIEALRSSIGGQRIEPHPYLVVGERVRITAGALAGMGGVLVRRKNNLRVVLALDVILRCVAVEVDACDVEPAGEARSVRTFYLPANLSAHAVGQGHLSPSGKPRCQPL